MLTLSFVVLSSTVSYELMQERLHPSFVRRHNAVKSIVHACKSIAIAPYRERPCIETLVGMIDSHDIGVRWLGIDGLERLMTEDQRDFGEAAINKTFLAKALEKRLEGSPGTQWMAIYAMKTFGLYQSIPPRYVDAFMDGHPGVGLLTTEALAKSPLWTIEFPPPVSELQHLMRLHFARLRHVDAFNTIPGHSDENVLFDTSTRDRSRWISLLTLQQPRVELAERLYAHGGESMLSADIMSRYLALKVASMTLSDTRALALLIEMLHDKVDVIKLQSGELIVDYARQGRQNSAWTALSVEAQSCGDAYTAFAVRVAMRKLWTDTCDDAPPESVDSIELCQSRDGARRWKWLDTDDILAIETKSEKMDVISNSSCLARGRYYSMQGAPSVNCDLSIDRLQETGVAIVRGLFAKDDLDEMIGYFETHSSGVLPTGNSARGRNNFQIWDLQDTSSAKIALPLSFAKVDKLVADLPVPPLVYGAEKTHTTQTIEIVQTTGDGDADFSFHIDGGQRQYKIWALVDGDDSLLSVVPTDAIATTCEHFASNRPSGLRNETQLINFNRRDNRILRNLSCTPDLRPGDAIIFYPWTFHATAHSATNRTAFLFELT